MAYRYYSTIRPVMLGGYPKEDSVTGKPYEVIDIVNYGERRQFDGFMAWGHIEYDRPLHVHEAFNYDLLDGRRKQFFMLEARIADGGCRAARIEPIMYVKKPTESCDSMRNGDMHVRYYFDTKQEAIDFMDGVDWVDGKSIRNLKVAC